MAGDYDSARVGTAIDGFVSKAPVVIFSQTDCKFCKKTKALLTDLGIAYEAVELDTMGQEGYAIRAELEKRTGRSSVPNVFIAGISQGGFSEGPNGGVEAMSASGELQALVE